MEQEDDSDLAFSLQVEEALTASLLDDAVSSPAPTSLNYDAVFGGSLSNLIQNDNLYKYELELLSQYNAEAEAKRLRLDLSRQIHDRAFACEILNVPEAEWSKTGDHINRPFGEGSSSSNGQVLGFRVYTKGLVERRMGGAIGVAICDGNDCLVFELSKCFNTTGNDQDLVEMKALIEGLEVASMLDLKRVTLVSDSPLIYQYIAGKNPQMEANVATLSDQINLLLRNFTHIRASLVALRDIKFAFELARNAMASQVNRSAGSSKAKNMTENCAICFDDTYVDQMFLIAGCQHSYCFSCMSKHVQFKLLQGIIPECPHENCKSKLELDSCKKFLTPELFDVMSQRVKEASIPATEKIYCPYPKCSTLLSKTELQSSIGSSNVVPEARKCPKCSGYFCINCKVPWHSNMTCAEFKRLNPYPCNEDKKLKSLATQNLWRQCPKCNQMVSLAEGCYHIYCRCGHEFCYTCGAEWKNKKATCKCPIWDERNIVYG
ncbi:hypothetical protein BUALT_Bualt13G0080300 [Buddleja alternifolia]|uniref:RBR-type E3 ubiquitin transferase n=1 Tax=Buddleja alternifolia TaxID=168488 RepID=A0AAV6WSE6_9LAMI|nr:hypothetical protein BUALT_Bualt13G0080300 [Buddleja alternifolia]